MKAYLLYGILLLFFSAVSIAVPKISFAAEDCIATPTSSQYYDPDSLFANLLKAKSGQCTKDTAGRQKILIDGIIEIKESQEQAIPTIVKGFILDSSNKIYLGPKDSSKVSEIKIGVPEIIINLKSSGNMIEGLTIYGGKGDCLTISGKDNTVKNNIFSDCDHYAISVSGNALFQLKDDADLTAQLLCTNTLSDYKDHPVTDLDLNANKKDDYMEYNKMIDGTSICAIWKSSGGKTFCSTGYLLDDTNSCSLCDEANNYYKNVEGSCALCSGDNKKLVDGQCICKDDTVEEWPAGSGLCINKCAEGETRNSEGACISDCPNQNEAKFDGVCACKEGFGRYFYNGMTKESAMAFPCVDCGTFKDTSTDRLYCLCGADQYRSLSGSCISACPENSKPEIDGKACICDQCYVYTWEDVNQPAYCKPIEGCTAKFTLDDCVALGEKEGKQYTLNAEGTACVEASGGNADCGCNFNAIPSSMSEVLLPYLMIAASGIWINFLKRRKH